MANDGGMKSEFAADKNLSCDANGKRKSGNEVRECATEKERLSALRLCFSVKFVCWLLALKERLLASLSTALTLMLDKGQSGEKMRNLCISCDYTFSLQKD